MTLLLSGEQRWTCPNCVTTAVTYGQPNRFHDCAGLKGLSAPMVLDGTNCKVEANDREDYVGRDLVQTDGEGRPVMNVTITRDEGIDCVVYAPTARAGNDG